MPDNDYKVYRGGSGRNHRSDSHAAWLDTPAMTCCGYPMPRNFKAVKEHAPTCKECRSVLRRLLPTTDDDRKNTKPNLLVPGATTLLTPAELNPPVVEKVTIPDLWLETPIDLTDNNSLRALTWRGVLAQAAQYDPSPVMSNAEFCAALNQIVSISRLAGHGYLVRVAPKYIGTLKQFEREFATWLQEHNAPYAKVYFDVAYPSATQTAPYAGADAQTAPAPAITEPQEVANVSLNNGVSADLTADNYGPLQSLVQQRRWKLVDQGVEQKAAYRQAIADVAANLNPPIAAETLQKFLGPRNALRFYAMRKNAENPNQPIGETPQIKRNGVNQPSALTQVRAWCQENAVLPKSKALAFFGYYSDAAYDTARRALEEEGWQFIDHKTHWEAVRPKSPEEQLMEKLQAQKALLDAEIAALKAQMLAR